MREVCEYYIEFNHRIDVFTLSFKNEFKLRPNNIIFQKDRTYDNHKINFNIKHP